MDKVLSIPWHDSHVDIAIPEKNIVQIAGIKSAPVTESEAVTVMAALKEDGTLSGRVSGKNVVLLLNDHTRSVPFDEVHRDLFPFLRTAKSLKVIIATGTHDGSNPANRPITDNVQYYAERNELPLTKIHVHNCHDDQFQFAGNTARGNAVYFNRLAAAADIFITVSDFKNHYFAGYSNPVKCFLPGICKYETVERNHALALKDEARFGHHPLHADPSRRNNPLAADMVQGCNLITNGSPVYVVALLTSRDKIIWCETGLLEKVTPIAFHEVDKRMSIEMPVADRLIVSCGGAPNDESLYTSQRALELSKNAVRPGGEVLFMAACANGIGPQKSVTNFYEPLRESPEKILTHLNEKYVMYAHKTYKFARMIQQLRGIHMHSKLSEEQVRAIHLVPAPQPQSVVDSWLKENPDCTINVVLDGNKFAIHAKQ